MRMPEHVTEAAGGLVIAGLLLAVYLVACSWLAKVNESADLVQDVKPYVERVLPVK